MPIDLSFFASKTGTSCPQCQAVFRGREDGAHRCPQCGDRVCRSCLSVNVFDKVSWKEVSERRKTGWFCLFFFMIHRPQASGAVCRVCMACARESFPRLFGDKDKPSDDLKDAKGRTLQVSSLSCQTLL